MRVCIFHQPFSKKLFMYTIFPQFRTSSRAISLTPWARIIENVRTKCIIFGDTHRIRVKKFKQNLREDYSKRTKIAITACKFSKVFRGIIPPDPLEPFLPLNQLQFCSAEKNSKKCRNYAPPPFLNFSLRLWVRHY